jgi:hypothetical protein
MDAARNNYRGGRVHCLAGCTDQWLTEHIEEPERDEVVAPWARETPRAMKCKRCHNAMTTFAHNTLYCYSCKATRQRERMRSRSRRAA